MLSSEEREIIFNNSYIPEHLVEYVCSISEAEPFFYEGYLYYLKDSDMIFIGFPLNKPFSEPEANDILTNLISKHRVKSVSVIGEAKLKVEGKTMAESSDHYYLLELSSISVKGKLKSSIKKAGKELLTEVSRNFTPDHSKIIDEYLRMEKFDNYTTHIFQMIPKYIDKAKTSLLINARAKDNTLAGFNVLDLGSKRYAFYMFNFISKSIYVPSGSDLLMYEMLKIAKREGKEFINLGLGINEGVVFFKKKWGGKVFLNYQFTYKIINEEKNSTIKRILSFITRYL